MNTLLIEIGTEEIPAGYIRPALEGFAALLLQVLEQNRIEHGSARLFGTPRRMAVAVEAVAAKQRALVTEVLGPPERIGFDAGGAPTVAAFKFAEKIGMPFNRITVRETPKGRYLCARKTERGLSTKTLMARILPRTIQAIPFPKAMKWAGLRILFARPIRSIMALWGNQVISFRLGNIASGRHTFGHSFMKPDKIKIGSPENYVATLRGAHVVADAAERRALLEKEIEKAAAQSGGGILPDDELVEIVTNLVEYPAAILGRFDKKFLELPQEILITAMREHQKYFAVVDDSGKLLPCFVAVNNTRARDMNLVAKGHERVLRARLEDARFFYKSDLTESMDERVEKLRGVLFQADLGSVYEKTMRLVRLVEILAEEADLDPKARDEIGRAALLCKADLVSQVVGEFPKLQGIMGRVYAQAGDEPPAVALAIAEHYQPTYSGGALPRSTAGALLGIADKIDSICGCFRVGLIPTGASDPYALRRQGIGIIQIMLSQNLQLSLRQLIERSLGFFAHGSDTEFNQTVERIYTFLRDRIAYLLADEGFSKDVIAAIVSVSVEHVPNVWKRARALQVLKSEPDFEPLAVAFKRVVNIIKQAGASAMDRAAGEVSEGLFEHACEAELFSAYKTVQARVMAHLDQGAFNEALRDIASLRSAVDAFFDGVLVMAEDAQLRANRLALLGRIAALFALFADFSKIST
ncbi:MAG: glycine--tRNA ligase subunit beta [Thermodesulfobacteriota bacterium]